MLKIKTASENSQVDYILGQLEITKEFIQQWKT